MHTHGIAFRRQCHIHFLPTDCLHAVKRTVDVDFCNDCLGVNAPEIRETIRAYGFSDGVLTLTLTRGKPGVNEEVITREVRHLSRTEGETLVLRDGEFLLQFA